MRRQDQSGGDDSVNLQAGENITLNVGLTASEVRDIALDVFHSNFLKLRGIAEEVARERADRITNEFIETLKERNPEGLGSIQDPDMLLSLYNAQKGYAASGEEDLEAALIDLLVDRAGQTTRNRKTLVLNQAIECVPKLTGEQRRALAADFLVRHVTWSGPLILPLFYSALQVNYAQVADISSTKLIDLQYAQSTGVGAVTPFELKLEEAFWQNYCGYLFKGISLDQTTGQLRTHGLDDQQIDEFIADRSVFIPCIRNASLWQFNATSMSGVVNLQAAKGLSGKPGHAGPMETLCLYGRMTDEEIRNDIVRHVPAMSPLFENWESSGLKGFQLTAIGIAVGHAYWRKATGAQSSLDTWI